MPERELADPTRKRRVALLFGGRSSEHTISCATAGSVLEHIDRDPVMSIQIQVEDNGEVSYGEVWTDGAELDRIRAWARRI